MDDTFNFHGGSINTSISLISQALVKGYTVKAYLQELGIEHDLPFIMPDYVKCRNMYL